jgi:hypothetical protein
VSVEEPPHALRELRFRALDVPPRRHTPNIAQATEGELAEAKMLQFARAWEIFRRPRRTPNPRPYHPIDPPR